MQSKTGFGILAAAGVAVGVLGMTMGGASGASTTSCRPARSAGASADRNASEVSGSSADRNRSATAGANGTSAAGDTTNRTGTDENSVDVPANPGATVVAGAIVPDGSVPASDSDSSSRDLPLLHLSERTSPTNAAGVAVPNTGTSVIGRSSNVSGLHIFGHVNGR